MHIPKLIVKRPANMENTLKNLLNFIPRKLKKQNIILQENRRVLKLSLLQNWAWSVVITCSRRYQMAWIWRQQSPKSAMFLAALRLLKHGNNIAQWCRLYSVLCNNTCSFCIFIGRELCVIKVHTHGWRQLMAWSNLANLFRGSSHDFCQLYYDIKQIDFIFLCFCTVIDHRWRHSVWRTKSHPLDCVSCVLFCSSYAMTSSVIYYSTDARKNEIYK